MPASYTAKTKKLEEDLNKQGYKQWKAGEAQEHYRIKTLVRSIKQEIANPKGSQGLKRFLRMCLPFLPRAEF